MRELLNTVSQGYTLTTSYSKLNIPDNTVHIWMRNQGVSNDLSTSCKIYVVFSYSDTAPSDDSDAIILSLGEWFASNIGKCNIWVKTDTANATLMVVTGG